MSNVTWAETPYLGYSEDSIRSRMAIEECLGKGNTYGAVAMLESAVASYLKKAMIETTVFEKPTDALRTLEEAELLVGGLFTELIARHESACKRDPKIFLRQPLAASSVFICFCVAVLQGNFPLAKTISQSEKNSPPFLQGRVLANSYLARIFYFLLDGDEENVNKEYSNLKEDSDSPQIFLEIGELASALSRRDELMARILGESSRKYLLREKLDEPGDEIYGVSGYSPIFFDFTTTVLVKVGIHRGLVSKDIVPKHLPESIFEIGMSKSGTPTIVQS